MSILLCIIHCLHGSDEGVDLVPGSIDMAGMDLTLTAVMSRETMLKRYIDSQKSAYDYVLIDCLPALGMLTIKETMRLKLNLRLIFTS